MTARSVRENRPGAAPSLAVAPIEVAPTGFPRLRGLRWGAEPATLLLHAPGGDLDDWRDLPPLLARRTGLGAVALDLPGHGLSDDAAAETERLGDPVSLIRAIASGPGSNDEGP